LAQPDGRVAQAVRRHGFPRGRMVQALRLEHREWPGPCSDGDESIATVAVRADDALPVNIAADKNTKLRHSPHQPQSGTPRRYLADGASGLCPHRPRSRRSEPSNGIWSLIAQLRQITAEANFFVIFGLTRQCANAQQHSCQSATKFPPRMTARSSSGRLAGEERDGKGWRFGLNRSSDGPAKCRSGPRDSSGFSARAR
jgi:hypothetical protein